MTLTTGTRTPDIVPNAAAARFVSLAVDAQRQPLVAYWLDAEGSSPTLMMARRVDGTWSSTEVIRTAGMHCSLALDGSGRPMIAYIDLDTASVMVATLTATGNGWEAEPVAAPVSGFVATAPILLASSEVCFASDGGVSVARKTVEGWTADVIDAGPTSGTDVDFAIDRSGVRHVLHRDPFAQRLTYLRDDGNGWRRSEIPWSDGQPSARLLGDGPSLFADTGRPLVAYWTDRGLEYATLGSDGSWSAEVVVAGTEYGSQPTVAVTGQGQPVIISLDTASGLARIASHRDGGWESVDVGPAAEVALAVDDRDLVHVALVDETGQLRSTALSHPPMALPLSGRTGVNTTLVQDLRAAVNADGRDLTVDRTPTVLPGNGTVRINARGIARYNPSPGYVGPDRFGFQVRDADGLTGDGTVDVEVIVPNLVTVTVASRQASRPTDIVNRISGDNFRNMRVVLQRRRGGSWQDVRSSRGHQFNTMIRPRAEEWETGPYRLEIRRFSNNDPYLLARSERFRFPSRRGARLIFRGSTGRIGVLRPRA